MFLSNGIFFYAISLAGTGTLKKKYLNQALMAWKKKSYARSAERLFDMFDLMDDTFDEIFGDKDKSVESASYRRDQLRRQNWFYAVSCFPIIRYRFWWFIHNCMIHPALGVWPLQLFIWCHDWTAHKLNIHDPLQESPAPAIPHLKIYLGWIVHNCIAHVAIGLCPCKATFRFHDKTAKTMSVDHWV